VDLITKYVIGRSGIVGLQFHRDNFSFGFSYDFPVFVSNEGNTGAFEAGLEWRRLIDPRKKKNSAAKRKPAATKPVTRTAAVKTPADTVASSGKSNAKVPAPTATTNTLSDRLRQKQDSIRAEAQAGNIQHEPLVLEKATLHFNFEFNSVALDDKASEYLDGLAKALQDNPELRIRLVGHTDNVGSEKFNQKLSVYRAEALKEFLVQRGVPADRIAAEGRGMKEALNDNRTDEDRAKNRRVELTILYE
jgi:outer membrane protein OmpA-like peptidoglycan-associated protein